MATRLRNITPNRAIEKTPDELWYGEKLKLYDHLIQFRRIGWIKKPQYQQKLEKKAEKMVCIGYKDDHAADSYRMYNPQTRRVIITQNIKWGD